MRNIRPVAMLVTEDVHGIRERPSNIGPDIGEVDDIEQQYHEVVNRENAQRPPEEKVFDHRQLVAGSVRGLSIEQNGSDKVATEHKEKDNTYRAIRKEKRLYEFSYGMVVVEKRTPMGKQHYCDSVSSKGIKAFNVLQSSELVTGTKLLFSYVGITAI